MATKNILAGTRKGLVVFRQNARGQWKHHQTHFLGLPVSLATYDPFTRYFWAMLDHGHWGCKLHRSKDGEHWEELEAPKYPEGAEVKPGVPASTTYLWSFASAGSFYPGKIYIGTEPGGLFVSENNGDDWRLVESLWHHPTREKQWFGGGRDQAAIHSILINPENPEHLFVGISVAGVFESSDGAKSWNPRNKGLTADFLPVPNSEVGQDPHLVDMCNARPEVMWQQNHCGIFRTTNGGQRWHDVSEKDGSANFGFAIAAHPDNPDVAWVVPGISDEIRVAYDQALCVCRTEDGGKSWQSFNQGLPQENVFDITYRHALDIHQNEVVFGTTTGNLYLSKNDGESWECLSHNLPMIYSLEFFEI